VISHWLKVLTYTESQKSICQTDLRKIMTYEKMENIILFVKEKKYYAKLINQFAYIHKFCGIKRILIA
jgi:hypothetical protein